MSRFRSLVPLKTVLLPGVLVVVAIVAGTGILASWTLGRDAAEAATRERLVARASDWTRFQQQRFRQLELTARLLASDEILLGYLEEPLAVGDTLEQYQNRLVFDYALIVDASGQIVARSGAVPESSGLGQVEAKEISTGIRREGDRVFHAVSAPLVRDYENLGRLLVGLGVDESSIRRVRSSRVEAFLVDPAGTRTLAATTAEPRTAEAVLRVLGDPVSRESSTRAPTEAEEGFRVHSAPLRSADGSEVVRLALVANVEREFEASRTAALLTAAAGLVAVILGALGVWGVARRIDRPLRDLVRVLESEDRDPELPGAKGPIEQILEAVRRRLAGDRTRQEIESRVARHLTGRPPGNGRGARDPRSQKLFVLGVDLCELVEARRPHDAEATRSDVARGLAIVAEEVEWRGGSWNGPTGSRIQASFAVDRARDVLAAAAAIAGRLESLGAAGSGEGPRMALAEGEVVLAELRMAEGERSVMIGSLHRRLDSLLREGSPGELLFSRIEEKKLRPLLEPEGIEPSERRSLLSPRPFLALSAPQCARAAGIEDPGAREEGVGQRFVPGSWLELRWEILGMTAPGSRGARLKAVDRETETAVRIDLLDPTRAEDLELRDRLSGIVRRLRDLRHPNVAPLLHFGRVEGRWALVSTWCEGQPLEDWLADDADLEAGVTLRIARDLASGLVALHERGQVHGAVDASRAVVDVGGAVRWIDAGLVSAFAGDAEPSQVVNDLLALGELLERLHGLAPEPRLHAVVRRATAPDEAARFATAVELRRALESEPQDLG